MVRVRVVARRLKAQGSRLKAHLDVWVHVVFLRRGSSAFEHVFHVRLLELWGPGQGIEIRLDKNKR
jgi:hypothetical protein